MEGLRRHVGPKLDFRGKMNQMQIQFFSNRVTLKETIFYGYGGTQAGSNLMKLGCSKYSQARDVWD